MRILVALNLFRDLTGSETYTLLLVKKLVTMGHEVEIYANWGCGLPLYDGNPRVKIWKQTDFSKNEQEYDVILTQHATATSRVLRTYPNTPAVSINHGITAEEAPQHYPNLLHYICISNEVAQEAHRQHSIPSKKISVVPNLIDLDEYAFEAGICQYKTFLWAGTISSWKVKSLEAVIRITSFVPGATLHVVGQNVLHFDFEPFDHVQFLGVKKLTSAFLAQFSMIFGVGRVALEALCSGIPTYIVGKDGSDGVLDGNTFASFKTCNFSGRFAPNLYDTMDYEKEAADIADLVANREALKRMKKDYKDLRSRMDSKMLVQRIEKILVYVCRKKSQVSP
jgi:glycosyltransferase involved in cell wall biosynthesis